MLKDYSKFIDRSDKGNCSICGKPRVVNCPILYGYNTRYECCFDCYKLYGTSINNMILRSNYEG